MHHTHIHVHILVVIVYDTYANSYLPCFVDDFRIFCGDLGNEVSDELLSKTFCKYPSFKKAKVIRDKKTGKPKGYGFVSFSNVDDFIAAMKEMNGIAEYKSTLDA